MKRYQKMAALFSIVWMVMIFCFSAQPSDDSGEVSGGVTETLVTTANFLFHWEMDQNWWTSGKVRSEKLRMQPSSSC